MDLDQEQELSNRLAADIYKLLARHNLDYHNAFLVLAATTAAIGNDDNLEEDYMLSILKSAIQADKQMQRMELQ